MLAHRLGRSDLPAPFGDEIHAGCDLVGLGAVAAAVAGGDVVQGVRSATIQRCDVVDGERLRVVVVGLVVDGFAAHMAGWFVFGDDAAETVTPCG